MSSPSSHRIWTVLSLFSWLLFAVQAPAQEPGATESPWQKASHFGADPFGLWSGPAEPEASAHRTARLQLFGMPAGFLADPLSVMEDDEDASPDDPAAAPGSNEPNNVLLLLGKDNPWFELRSPGMPGGLGFYQCYFQMQLLEDNKTSVCLNMQALTPAGIQYGGVDKGPTVVNPSVAWFQDLGGGAALQGFVGKQIRANSGWMDNCENGLRCGMGLQCPVPVPGVPKQRNLYLFVQALGWYNSAFEPQPGQPVVWEIVPGIHWRVADNCWLSIGHARSGMLTCSWRY